MTEKPRRDEPQAGLPRSGDPGFNLDRALKSIVTVQSSIPEDAFTAQTLGEQRSGSGVVIRESGLVLTIGYLIMEAENVWLADAHGRVTPAHALAVDAESGFGLVQALDRLDSPALDLGRSSEAKLGDPVIVASGAGVKPVRAMIVGKQEFAGYWEYLLDEAIFTSPAHPFWGGAGAIDQHGRLIGIGSLHVEQLTARGGPRDINMVVPIDLLPPILDDLLAYGRVNKPARPWLGVYSRRKRRRDYRGERLRQWPGRGRRLTPRRRSRRRRRVGDREPRRFLSQDLEPRAGGRRNPDRDRARRPRDGSAHPFRGSRELPQAPTLAVRAEPRFSRQAGARRRSR